MACYGVYAASIVALPTTRHHSHSPSRSRLLLSVSFSYALFHADARALLCVCGVHPGWAAALSGAAARE
jgi:hypothetical protein